MLCKNIYNTEKIFQFRGVTGSNGAFAIMGAVDPESFDTLHSFSNAFEMPFVTPWFPEKNFGKLTVDVHLNCRNKRLSSVSGSWTLLE